MKYSVYGAYVLEQLPELKPNHSDLNFYLNPLQDVLDSLNNYNDTQWEESEIWNWNET